MSSVKFESMSYSMFLLLLVVIGMILFLLIFEPRFSKRKLKNKNEHGSSRFANKKEIEKNYQKESLLHITKVGFPVWYEKANGKFDTVYFDTKSPHYLLVGSTGSGKSVTVSIPMCIQFAIAKEKHSVVVTDPKGELFKTTGKIFKDNGYDVVTIDFRNPNQSNKINIMQPIIDEWKNHCRNEKNMIYFFSYFLKRNKISIDNFLTKKEYSDQIRKKYKLDEYLSNIIKVKEKELNEFINDKHFFEKNELSYSKEEMKKHLKAKNNEELLDLIKDYQNSSSKNQAETNRLVISLANLIFTEKESKDPFWINASKQLFIGICGIFLEDYKLGLIDENRINLSSIKKFQNSSLTKENQKILQNNLNLREYGSLSKDYLTSIISSAENTYKSITAIFGEKMSIFDDLNVENLTSISSENFKFANLGKKPTALYIIVPDEDRSYFQLVTIIVGMLIKDLTKFANMPENNGTLPVKVEWILDEFANCPPLDSIETVVSVARSRGMRFYFFIQSFSQLDQVYGKEISNIIQDNCALVYLKTNTVETAEVIAKKLGKETIETNSISNSTDPFKIGGNQTTSLMGKELLTVNEIINLKYKTIIFPTFGNPIFRDTYMYDTLFPKYANYEVLERKSTMLKRLTENYYTVEDMGKKYTSKQKTNIDNLIRMENEKFENESMQKMNKILNHSEKFIPLEINSLDNFFEKLKKIYGNILLNIEKINKNTIYLELNGLLNNFDFAKIYREKSEDISFCFSRNIKQKRTVLIIWKSNEPKL